MARFLAIYQKRVSFIRLLFWGGDNGTTQSFYVSFIFFIRTYMVGSGV